MSLVKSPKSLLSMAIKNIKCDWRCCTSGDMVDKVDGSKYACCKKPICPICPHKWFHKKDTSSEKETIVSWGPVEIYIHRFKEPCKFFISSWSL